MVYPKGLSVVPIKGLTIARLYNTNIVVVDHTNGTIELNSGGWHTRHTKKCTNLILSQYNYHVYQEDFTWYVSRSTSVVPALYQDNMVLSI